MKSEKAIDSILKKYPDLDRVQIEAWFYFGEEYGFSVSNMYLAICFVCGVMADRPEVFSNMEARKILSEKPLVYAIQSSLSAK